MGGYAAYVWPSFAVTAIVLLVMVFSSLRGLHKAQQTLTELQNLPRNET